MPLKEKTIAKVNEDVGTWPYLAELPQDKYGLSFKKLYEEEGDKYYLFSYTNEEKHLGFWAYYHQETEEYKVKIRMGLTEFCLMQYITAKAATFESFLRQYMDADIHDLVEYNPDTMSYITKSLNITEWDYSEHLPPEVEGFKLFIKPHEPKRVLNGSYIVADYSDFSIESNFIIYYNEFRCEFFGEARVKNIPEMRYDFDSKTIEELEQKLDNQLAERLRGIRERAQ